MASGASPNVIDKLPGKLLTKDNTGRWQITKFREVATELSRPSGQEIQIFSVESTHDRKARFKLLDKDSKNEEESFEVFASDKACSDAMINTYNFPNYLFSKSWAKSNGFAGLKRVKDYDISWFRILVKMIKSMDHYYWHEMTFFIHQPRGQGGHVTVLCFEVPDDDVDDTSTKLNGPTTLAEWKPEIEPHNFLEELKTEFDNLPAGHSLDWRYVQSLLLRQAIVVVDRGVWACSKAVRKLEKSRPKTTPGLNNSFNFPSAHDLLRHALHSTEILQVASKTLASWLDQYNRSEKLLQREEHNRRENDLRSNSPQYTVKSYDEDTPLPMTCYHAELIATLQLLSNLKERSASNDARLRNEINLAFNVVNQQDTKAMRAVSVVTLLFLPATFVSTLFSMTFFNQPSPQQSWGVTSKIWIYFVISGILTGLTFISWFWGLRIWRWLLGKSNK